MQTLGITAVALVFALLLTPILTKEDKCYEHKCSNGKTIVYIADKEKTSSDLQADCDFSMRMTP
jgi:hypothetical protein